jgi:hypothetical protein
MYLRDSRLNNDPLKKTESKNGTLSILSYLIQTQKMNNGTILTTKTKQKYSGLSIILNQD